MGRVARQHCKKRPDEERLITWYRRASNSACFIGLVYVDPEGHTYIIVHLLIYFYEDLNSYIFLSCIFYQNNN